MCFRIAGSHAAPAKFVMASLACHINTSTVLFKPNTTVRTSTNIFGQSKATKSSTLLVVATSSLVPRLLTIKASEVVAIFTFDFDLFSDSQHFFLALGVRTKEHVRVCINFAGKSYSEESFVILLAKRGNNNVFGDRSVAADAFKC